MAEEDLPTLDELREAVRKVLDGGEIGKLADTELATAVTAAFDKLHMTEEADHASDVISTINCGYNLYHTGSLEGEDL